MKIERRLLADLAPFPENPRIMSKHDMASLSDSIASFGCLEPIIVNDRTGHIVAGHQRRAVLIASGQTEHDVVIVDLDEQEEIVLNLALNRIRGDWDWVKLGDLMRQFSTDELRTKTGFSQDEIARLISGAPAFDSPGIPYSEIEQQQANGHSPEIECPNCHQRFQP